MDIKGIKLLVQEPEVRTRKTGAARAEHKLTSSSEINEAEFSEMTNLALGLAQRIGADQETSLAAVGELSSTKVFSLTEQGIAV